MPLSQTVETKDSVQLPEGNDFAKKSLPKGVQDTCILLEQYIEDT